MSKNVFRFVSGAWLSVSLFFLPLLVKAESRGCNTVRIAGVGATQDLVPNFVCCATTPAFLSGFYVGFDFGITQILAKVNSQYSATNTVSGSSNDVPFPTFSSTLTNDGNSSIGRQSPVESVHFGYNQRLGNSIFCIGAEGYAFYTNSHLETTKTNGNSGVTALTTTGDDTNLNYNLNSLAKFELNFDSLGYGVSIRPGILITPSTVLFTRLGYVFNKVEYKTTNRFRATDTTTIVDEGPAPLTETTNDVQHIDKTKNIDGFTGGIGIAQYVADNVSIEVEYDHTDFGNTNQDAISDTTGLQYEFPIGGEPSLTPAPLEGGAQSSNDISLTSNSVHLSLNYHF